MTGILFLLAGPSGVGKSTVQARLVRQCGLATAQGYFTRPMRPGEDGVDSTHLTIDEFMRMRDAGELTAVNEFAGHWYGTPKRNILAPLQAGKDVIRIFTPDGIVAAKRDFAQFPIVTIFLTAPLEVLAARLTSRGDSADVRERRMAAAVHDLQRVDDFDYLVAATGSAWQVTWRVEWVIRWEQHQQSNHAHHPEAA